MPITYLGIPISGRRPRRHDWECVILKVRKRLSTWKGRFLSLGGRLTLVNSVLSVLPTYWLSIFRIPAWVIKKIDQIRRDFLWSGPDIDQPTCRLVCWKNLCRSHDQRGWGILDLFSFIPVLLGKWWWKFMTDEGWLGSNLIQFNYNISRWNLLPRILGRISYFLEMSTCLLASFSGPRSSGDQLGVSF